MDSYIKFYRETFGKYPQVDADMRSEPSACFFGEKDDEGYIQWKYVEQPAYVDFDRMEKKRCVHVCDEVKQLYHSYLFLELQGFLDGSEGGHISFDPVMEETEELFFP